MFVIGYISGISVAIVLSIFYVVCAVEYVSEASKEKKNYSENLLVIQADSKCYGAFIDYDEYFQSNDNVDPKVPTVNVVRDFPLPKSCNCRKTVQLFKLFSRPPPYRG
ncbi:MAG: hypothetical protein LBC98_03160 [Prevotellaceae bacterium]|jgi:hypothetical protein|nr:hypothetical protein [Prevotellaceae bacterium]